MQCETDDFTFTIQGLDNELKQTKEKKSAFKETLSYIYSDEDSSAAKSRC
jgi:hypothetical protein